MTLLSQLAALHHAAHRDPLTGTRNRRSYDPAGAAAVILVDIDRFKAINDTHGHEVGDEVLIELAERITGTVRAGDVVHRWGGDEFVIVAHGDPACLVERLRAVTLPPVATSAGPLTVTVSIGAGPTLSDADQSMYRVKESAR